MPFKVTLLMQQATGVGGGGPAGNNHIGGWSESYYDMQASSGGVQDRLFNANVDGPGLCPARAGLLSRGGAIIGQRITELTAQLVRTGRSQSLGRVFPGNTFRDTDVPQMALSMTVPSISTANIQRRSLRGIADDQVTFGEFTPTFAFLGSLTSFKNQLGPYRFMGQNLAVTNFQVLTITGGGLVTLAAAHAFAVGDPIQVQSTVIDASGRKLSIKGKVLTIGPTLDQLTIADWLMLPTHGGTLRSLEFVLCDISVAGISFDRATVRKVGRPFGGYRGRRSKRRVI